MRTNLPNQITIGRLFLAIVFLALLAAFDLRRRATEGWMLDAALVIFIVAAGTDWLDGYLARRQDQVTSFGRILDPFVDKLLIVGAFVLLLGQGFRDDAGREAIELRPWMVVLIIARELMVSGLRGFSESQGTPYAANWWGKIKMFLQCIAVAWIIASVGFLRGVGWVTAGRPIVIWAAVLFTAASVVAYLITSRKALGERTRAQRSDGT
jgi:CDP-diacylglycerol---glycerol-3-phosphate 3-phosphatidyltransferase